MKKVILILAIGAFLTSCGRGWSCKKRYCKSQLNKIEKSEQLTFKSDKNTAVVQP